MRKALFILLIVLGYEAIAQKPLMRLKISPDKRRIVAGENNIPFFWQGDTGWLLFIKCTREEILQYLDDRMAKGFNVVQAMLVHDLNRGVNIYGDSALHNKDVSQPVVTPGNKFEDQTQYDFWDHVDFAVKEAAKRGIYMALVPVWGGNIKNVTVAQATSYGQFLAKRYKKESNIIWLNGGDIKGSDALDKWNALGTSIRSIDKQHLMTFHPRGRNSSSAWFNNESWLDFNMFQSGHRSYEQDTSANETLHYGEDNWRYAEYDYNLKPTRPTIDGEPSYEDIPYGLHDGNQPYWQDFEIRRYAYWSVFAGAFGFTYGHNSVMQFYTPGDKDASFFPKIGWQEALKAPGAGQIQYLKELILSKTYVFPARVPAQSLIIDNGEKYDRVLATKGKNYALIYVYNGRTFIIDLSKLDFLPGKYSWFNPRNGERTVVSGRVTGYSLTVEPPGGKKNGNDWVFIVEK